MKKYQAPEIETVIFYTNDILVASGDPDVLPDDEWGNPDELPDDEW